MIHGHRRRRSAHVWRCFGPGDAPCCKGAGPRAETVVVLDHRCAVLEAGHTRAGTGEVNCWNRLLDLLQRRIQDAASMVVKLFFCWNCELILLEPATGFAGSCEIFCFDHQRRRIFFCCNRSCATSGDLGVRRGAALRAAGPTARWSHAWRGGAKHPQEAGFFSRGLGKRRRRHGGGCVCVERR